MAIEFSGSNGGKARSAAELIHMGSKKISNLLTGKVDQTISVFFEEIGFEDDRAADYRVYFNAASFRQDDDRLAIQFIYIGYVAKKTSLQMSIGTINGDNLSLQYGAVIDLSESASIWNKGGEFQPVITTRTTGQIESGKETRLIVLEEDKFLRTSLDYVRQFEHVAVVELNDAHKPAGGA